MIRVRRCAIAEDLRDWLAQRAAQLREYLNNNQDPPEALLDSYRHPPLKAHLTVEAHGKCIYCESKITHVYFGDVEHIKPKSEFPAERLDLENLALTCARCNNAKREFWDAIFPLLNPYEDNPDEELLLLGFMIARRPGRPRARLTIERLKLNRTELLERRKERIESLQALADQYVEAPDGPIKDLIKAELLQHAADSGEYAMVVRAYLEAACGLKREPEA